MQTSFSKEKENLMNVKAIMISTATVGLLLGGAIQPVIADPIDWCDEGSNSPDCREKGPFDVTQTDYQLGISFSNNFYEPSYDFSVQSLVSNSLWAHIRGWTNLAQETSDWEYHRELQEGLDFAEQKNLNSSDFLAYAVVYQVNMRVEIDGKTFHIHDTDVVSGTDWDNNGKIDALEGHPSIRHTVSRIQPRY